MKAAQGARLVDRALIAYARGPEHPAKIRILHRLIRHLTAGRVQVDYAAGARVTIDPADYIGWSILRTGSYEPASLALALRLMTGSSGLFVDVGANFGWFSAAIAALPGSRVIAIEPDCGSCAALRANLANFPDAIVVNAAAGDKLDVVGLAQRSPGNTGTVAIMPGRGGLGAAPRAWTATLPLHAILAAVTNAPEHPVLLKIDVEGFERNVLRGIDFAGPFRPRSIIMEYTTYAEEAWGGLAVVAEFFAARGYEVTDVLGRPLDPSAEPLESNIWARER